jgi:hypothetical protein
MDLFDFEAFGQGVILADANGQNPNNENVGKMLGLVGAVPQITQQKVSKEITQDIFL